MDKEIIKGQILRDSMLSGVTKVYDAVAVTLGSNGKYVIMPDANGRPRITKDGVSIAKEISLENFLEDMSAKLVIEGSFQTLKQIGDGTTSTVVMAYFLAKNFYALPNFNGEHNNRELLDSINYAISYVQDYLDEIADNKTELTREELISVATISANNDPKLGKLIGETYHKIGESGVVRINYKEVKESYTDISSGYILDSGLMHHSFMNHGHSFIAKEPLIFITNQHLDSVEVMAEILQVAHIAKKSVIVIANSFSEVAMTTIKKNYSDIPCLPLIAPNNDDRRDSILEDLSVITGSTFLDHSKDMMLEEFVLDSDKDSLELFGICKDVLTNIEETVFNFDEDSKGEAYDAHVAKLVDLSESTDSEVAKEFTNFRIARIKGNIAIIHFDSTSQYKMGLDYDRVDDALRACRSALKHGIVPGVGKIYLDAMENFIYNHENDKTITEIQWSGYSVVLDSLVAVTMQNLKNSNYSKTESKEIMLKMQSSGKDVVYCTLTHKMGNAFTLGILESAKSPSACFKNSAATLTLLSNIGCGLVNIPDSIL